MKLIEIINADCLTALRAMADGSVQCCVTSPPYWGLRDYGLPATIFGGQRDCAHEWQAQRYYTEKTAASSSADAFSEAGEENADRLKSGRWREDNTCALCGAWLGQLGLEKHPDDFIEHLREIFDEVFRVLRDDGILWMNLGDCYSGSGRGNGDVKSDNKGHVSSRGTNRDRLANGRGDRPAIQRKKTPIIPETRGSQLPAGLHEQQRQAGQIGRAWVPAPEGLKNKDLVGIPWMAAFALRRAGWYLRSEVIWNKPGVMPESVTDRPTKSHEQLFLLSKTSRYYYDAAAIAEPCVSGPSDIKKMLEQLPRIGGKHTDLDDPLAMASSTTNIGQKRSVGNGSTRNKRSVWTVASAQYDGAHFATFPEDLIKPCIMAGCPLGGVVLDPFGGSGTTGKVALELGRRAILIELNPEYCKLIQERTTTTPGLAL